MTREQERIRLAEVIYGPIGAEGPEGFYSTPYGSRTFSSFDPFTDANDDYAVLEWVRTDAINWDAFVKALPHQNLWHFVQEYQIGDYARAVLKARGEQQ